MSILLLPLHFADFGPFFHETFSARLKCARLDDPIFVIRTKVKKSIDFNNFS